MGHKEKSAVEGSERFTERRDSVEIQVSCDFIEDEQVRMVPHNASEGETDLGE